MAAPSPPITVSSGSDGLVRVYAAETYAQSILNKLFGNEMCDITLIGKAPPGIDALSLPPINAHKLILAVVSPFLNERFKVHNVKSNITVYKLDHIDHNSLQNIVTFIYTSHLQFPQVDAARNIRSIIIGAKHLAMNDLASSCEAYLANTEYHLSPQTCISTWLFAVLYECNVLLHACLNMFAANVGTIRSLNDFLHLGGDNVVLLLKTMTMEPYKTACKADDLCQAAIAWLEYDRAKRKTYVEAIAKLIPFERVSRNGLLKASRSKELEATVMPILYKAMKRKLEEVDDDDDADGAKHEKSSTSVKQENKDGEVGDDGDDENADEDDEDDQVREPDQKIQRVAGKKEDAAPLPMPTLSPTALALLAKLPSNTPTAAMREIYVIGGSNREANRTVQKYDVLSKKWNTLPAKLPWTRSSAGNCLLGKNLMFCGGRKNSVITNDIDFYSLSKHQCFTLPTAKLLKPRSGCCAVAIADGLMICGGCDEDEDNLATVEKLVVSSGKIEPLAAMQRGRCDAAAVVVGNGAAVLVAGGTTESTLPIEMYECPRNAWSYVGALPTVRYGMGACVLNDNVYYAGGYDVNGDALDTVQVFNTRTGQLRVVESKMKQARGACSAVCMDGTNTFAVFGGKTSQVAGRSKGVLQTVEMFDARTESWIGEQVVPPMPVPMADGLVLGTWF